MARKSFIGVLVDSKVNEFTGSEGEVIRTWKLGLLLSETKGMNFDVSINNPLYETVNQYKIDDRVKVEADPEIRMDGKVKWRLADIVLADTNDGPPESIKGSY